MYAVIETGGHQLRVQVGEVVRVARLGVEVGSAVEFDRVLLVGGEGAPQVGRPSLEGARVRGTVVGHDREPKVLVYWYKKRKNSGRKSRGHRQAFTAVKIDAIES